MSETEFFYWLQGFFEIAALGEDDVPLALVLHPRRADCVLRHAALVRADSRHMLGQQFNRCEFLAELLIDPTIPPETRADFTRKMQACLAREFQHVIDPQAGDAEQQAELNKLHHGDGRPPVYRC